MCLHAVVVSFAGLDFVCGSSGYDCRWMLWSFAVVACCGCVLWLCAVDVSLWLCLCYVFVIVLVCLWSSVFVVVCWLRSCAERCHPALAVEVRQGTLPSGPAC